MNLDKVSEIISLADFLISQDSNCVFFSVNHVLRIKILSAIHRNRESLNIAAIVDRYEVSLTNVHKRLNDYLKLTGGKVSFRKKENLKIRFDEEL